MPVCYFSSIHFTLFDNKCNSATKVSAGENWQLMEAQRRQDAFETFNQFGLSLCSYISIFVCMDIEKL